MMMGINSSRWKYVKPGWLGVKGYPHARRVMLRTAFLTASMFRCPAALEMSVRVCVAALDTSMLRIAVAVAVIVKVTFRVYSCMLYITDAPALLIHVNV